MPKDQELEYLIGRLKNQTGAAEGSNFPPRLISGRRVPIVTSLKTMRATDFSGGTEFTLSWIDVELSNVNGYNVYVTGLLSDNKQPALVGLFKRSPAQFRVESNIATKVTFTVQTVLNNGLVSDLDRSPSCTGATIAPTISVSDLGPGTPGQLITWDPTGTPTTIGPGTADHILVGSGAGAVPQFKSRATLDLIEGRSTVTALGQILVGSAAAGVAKTIAAGAADSILVGSGAGADPQFKTRATLDLVEGRGNLTDVGAVPYVSASGVLSDDPADFFWDATNNFLGIGTNAPVSKLHTIDTVATSPRGATFEQVSNDAQTSMINVRKARGTVGTRAAINSGDVIGRFNFQGYDGSAFVDAGLFRFVATENFSGTARGTECQLYTTPNGSTVNTLRMTIENDGDLMYDGGALYFDATNDILAVGTSTPWTGGTSKFQARTGADQNFVFAGPATLATGCTYHSFNDAVTANVGLEFRGFPIMLFPAGATPGVIVGRQPTSPLALLHVSHHTLGNAVFRVESVATNDDPAWNVYQNRIATTDATVTTIHTVAIPASTTVALVAYVNARRTGGAAGTAEDGAFYIRAATFKNVAGVATQIGATTAIHTNEDQAGWDVTFAVAAGNALVQVTGAVNNNITWHLFKLDYSPVGS